MILQGFLRILSFFDIAEAIEMEKLRFVLGPEASPRSRPSPTAAPNMHKRNSTPPSSNPRPSTLSTGEKLKARIKYYWFGVAASNSP